tara:strand:+ start:620 stop:913 length:294 start_codon:yes stop_codon:yes gene_type:complete
MNNKKSDLQRIKKAVIPTLRKYGIKKAGIFGSLVTGQQKKSSDIDILVEPPKSMGLEFVGMKIDLENQLKKKVDLVTYRSVHPYLRKSIMKTEVRIL